MIPPLIYSRSTLPCLSRLPYSNFLTRASRVRYIQPRLSRVPNSLITFSEAGPKNLPLLMLRLSNLLRVNPNGNPCLPLSFLSSIRVLSPLLNRGPLTEVGGLCETYPV